MPKSDAKISFPELPIAINESIDIENNKIKDFISDEWVTMTPEEVEAVQVFARRLVEDYGYKKEQIQTHPQFRVRRRPSDEKKEYPVDIAVFKGKNKIESELFMIIECKQPNEQSGLRQLKIYMDLSPAVIGVWFNGQAHAYIRKTQKTDGTIDYIPIPNIPLKDQRIEDIGLFKRKDLKPTKNLKAVFKDIRNHLSQQAVGIARDESIAQQVMNILFCKIYDEINTAPNEIVSFRSGVTESSNNVAKRIKSIFEKVKTEYDDIFEQNESLDLDDISINYVVGELQNYCITDAERDVLGDAFEVFIGTSLKGAQGQFFTPRNVVKLAVAILEPSEKDIIIDPACGSGGFLIVAVENIWNKIKENGEKRGFNKEWVKNRQKDFANKNVRGIDKDSFLTKVTKAYMAIIGDGRGGIFCENSLDPASRWKEKARKGIVLGNFDILLTNPPFGSKIPVKEREILEQFEIGYKWQKKDAGKNWEKTQKLNKKLPPQILFIERCLELLKLGGRMAIVLPDGVLGGSKVGYVANFIRHEAKILAMIDLPKETFQPSTPTKTHILFLQKKTDEEKKSNENFDSFMAIATNVGHDSKGKPLFQEIKGEKVLNDDLPEIVTKYKAFKNGKLKKTDYSPTGYVVNSKWLENYLVAKRYLPKYIDVLVRLENLRKSGVVELKTLKEIKKTLTTGANISGDEYVEKSDYRYIMTDCVTRFGINYDSLKFITKKAYDTNKNRVLKEDDIVINRTGNPGTAILVSNDIAGTMSCGFVFVLKVKEPFDPYYITAFLNSRFGIMQAKRCSFGSLLEHITKDDLEGIIIPFPKNNAFAKKIVSEFKIVTQKQVETRSGLKNILDEFEKFS